MGKKGFNNALRASFSPITDENWLFFIGGQSDAEGWNNGAPAEPHLNGVIPRVFMYNGALTPMEYGVSNKGFNGHGVELNLGYLASQLTTGNIYFSKSTRGASPLADDPAITADWSTTGTLFPDFVNLANGAINKLNNENIPFVYKGMWWDQGQSDAAIQSFADQYSVLLPALEARVRSQVISVPASMPFVNVRVSSESTYPYLETVRSAQIEGGRAFVNTDDLTLHDGVHSDSLSQNKKAQRIMDLVL